MGHGLGALVARGGGKKQSPSIFVVDGFVSPM